MAKKKAVKKFTFKAKKKPVIKVLTFKEALAKAGDGKKHLLTGNGFSMAWDYKRFSYQALFNRAGKGLSAGVQRVFSNLGTSDFEVVMKLFRDAARLVKAYHGKGYPKLTRRLQREAESIRDALAKAVSASHPDRPADIPVSAYRASRRFLSHFKNIYTLNYDLLLYWSLMQDELEPAMDHDDGFRTPEDGPETYVTWEIEKTDGQNVFYLHGALHVFDAEYEVQKFTWCNTGLALIDQIRAALDDGKFPIFVSEGTSHEKMARIQHSNFLGRGYRSFAKISGPLFIFGHSLAENDEHILKLIDNGKTGPIFVSLFGDPESDTNKTIIARANQFKGNRKKPIEVHFFDAQSAKVWGK